MQLINGTVTSPIGFLASGVYCGLRKNASKPDLALIYSDKVCNAAGVYTQNIVKGAPIAVTKDHIADGTCRAVICNSGNANTCNADGYEKAQRTCETLAKKLGIAPSDVAVASTGVIGQPLKVELIEEAIPALVDELSYVGGEKAARAIMTTDLVPKEVGAEVEIGGKKVTIGAICKGSGMIKPNMATMLCFITTDAAIATPMLQSMLKEAVDASFNRVSVDGDSSTNDTVLLMANGMAENPEITEKNADYAAFVEALKAVCVELARKLARDGEGATKLITCNVLNAETEQDAVKLAKSVIMSSLVKAAMFGKDANWGRILCAMGYAGVPFDPETVTVSMASKRGTITVYQNGGGLEMDEELALEILGEDEIIITADMQAGTEKGCAWGCDLTYKYVEINGAYRT